MIERRWFWVAVVVGALCVPGCGERAKQAQPVTDTVPDTVTPPRMLAMAVSCTEAAKWADTIRVPGSVTYRWLRCIPAQVVVDSQRTILADVRTRSFAFGLFHLPSDSLDRNLGYSAIAFTVDSARLAGDLAKVRAKGGSAVLLVPRAKSKDAAGNLSVAAIVRTVIGKDTTLADSTKRRVGGWDSAAVAKALADSTIVAINVGDDITAEEYGPAPLAVRLARYDSAAVAVRKRWPAMPVSIRARASQLRARSPWLAPVVLWVQYNGPRRDGPPARFAKAQADSARSLNMTLMLGLNLLDGGCGPSTDQPADTLKRCPKGIPGTGAAGTWGPSDSAAIAVHRYLMSGPETGFYGAVFAAEPASCAEVNWQWSSVLYLNSTSPRWQRIRKFHADSLVGAAARTVGLIAKARPFTRCTR